MKIILFILSLCFAAPSLSCMDESKEKQKIFARIIQQTKSDIDVAVFYPKENQKALISSVTVAYYQGNDFSLIVDAKIGNSNFGIPNIDLKQYASTYISLKSDAINEVEISFSYNWPPAPDGSVVICGPSEHHKLHEIIESSENKK